MKIMLIILVCMIASLNGCNNGQEDGGEELLIDDCEDGDNINQLEGLWVSYDDYHDGGESVVWPLTIIDNAT